MSKNCELWAYDESTNSFVPVPGNGTNPKATAASVEQLATKSDKSLVVPINITTSWTGSAPPYSQTISVEGVTANNTIEITLPASATDSHFKAFNSLELKDGGQALGQITIKAYGYKNASVIPVTAIIRGDI